MSSARSLRPTRRLSTAALAWLVLSLAAAFWPPALTAWVVAGAALFVAAAIDCFLLARTPPLALVRDVAQSLALGRWTEVQIELRNPTARAEELEFFDGVPSSVETEGLPIRLRAPAQSGLRFAYRMRALRRGDTVVRPAHVLRVSRGKLWASVELVGEARTIRIYPDFAAVAGFTLHGLENRIQMLGIRRRQRRGEGLEFRQLREYVAGDMLRQVDWKATSRRQKLISREYQEERDQQIVFLLDCGRRMRAIDGALTHFDHCLNALLLVAYIALRQGDAVGLMTFGARERWLAPIKGRASMNVLINAVYDLDTSLEPPDYVAAAARVRALQSRRSLIVLVTNQRDDDEEELRPALALLRKRHLVLLASLRETSVERFVEAPLDSLDAAVRHCAALDYFQARRRALERLRGAGTLTLDVAPARLPVALAEKYLDIKRAGRL